MVGAALVGTGLLLSGCVLGPNFVKPDAEIVPEWNLYGDVHITTSQAPDYADWWQVFNDPVLDRLCRLAYEQNLPLQIAGLQVLEARAQLAIAVGNFYPQQQSASGAVLYDKSSRNTANTEGIDLNVGSASIGLQASWELDLWGKFRRGIESADADLLSSIASYDDLLVSLTAQVADTYVVIRTFEERIATAEANVKIQTQSLAITETRFAEGAITELDVEQAKTLLFNTQATIPGFRIQLRQAKNALATLLGRPPGQIDALLSADPAVIPAPPTQVVVGIPADLLRRRPDVRQAELQAAAQSALIGVAKTDLYPSISIFGTLGLAADADAGLLNGISTRTGKSGFDQLFDGDSLFFTPGVDLSWNILNYGRIKNNVRVQDARLQQLIVNYQNTVLQAAQEVQNALVGFVRSQEQAALLGDSVTSARKAVELSRIQYQEGLVTYTPVLITQTSLLNQQDLEISVRGAVSQNLVGLYRALGGGWEIHHGQPFVAEETQQTMGQRTDWGTLLTPQAGQPPTAEEKQQFFRWPDW